MLLQIRASSIVPAYFSAPNHNESLPAKSKSPLGSKPSAEMQAFRAALALFMFGPFSKLATTPMTFECCGLPPGGTWNRTTSSDPVAHSTPKSMRSQLCGSWSMRPGSSALRRSSCAVSWSATMSALHAEALMAARMPVAPRAAMQGTMPWYAHEIENASRRAFPAPADRAMTWPAPRYLDSFRKATLAIVPSRKPMGTTRGPPATGASSMGATWPRSYKSMSLRKHPGEPLAAPNTPPTPSTKSSPEGTKNGSRPAVAW
mmetsp:Transcript_96548/g.295345  ORF Transcript_96548/g.295345 Transcript_96548/m.295345 type:complete len:260 (+) Transcript_96548:352-1131(+)